MTDEQQSVPADISGAQGLQLGSGNTQFNLWLQERQLDAQRVEALNDSAAASYIARLSAEDAAFVLATATARASAGVLRVLLSRRKDKNLAIEIITRINRIKAQELVAAIGPAAAELEMLPEAAEEIAEYEDTGVPELGEPTGGIAVASESQQRTRGYYQNFQDGQIHWSARGGAQPTRGANAVYHIGLGGSGSRLGFPLTPDKPAQRSPFGTDGSYQRFESSWNYNDEICERLGLQCGATVYWCDTYGAHATWGGIGEYYELNGGTGGPLGFPVSDEVEVGPSHRDAEPRTAGWCQHFEGGAVYWSEKTKAVAVTKPVADYLDLHNGVASRRGFPVSPGLPAADSPYGTKGRLQRFEGAWDYPKDILDHWLDVEGPGGATIYTSEAHGVYCVGWGNGILYERLAGTSSWLGFPKSDETDPRASKDEPRCSIQEFEGGAIFYKEKYGSVPVSSSIMDYLSQHDGLRQRLGFPVKEARSLVSGDDEQVLFFEHGIVTIRNGVTEVWVRPDDILPPGSQEVALLALECSSTTVIPGETMDLKYRIRSGSDRAFPAGLGASLVAANGDDYFDKAGDRDLALTPGENTYLRRLQVPSSTPHGAYRLIGAVWCPRVGTNRLAKLDRGFIVNVVGEEEK